jgi:hypothetical protein
MKKGTTYQQTTDEEVKFALKQADGLISPAADILGVARTTLQMRLRKNPDLKQYQIEIVEATKDKAESKLQQAIDNGDSWAIQFYLKTQARDRGFGDQLLMNLSSVNANINVDYDLNKLSLEEAEKFYEFITRAKIENGDNEHSYLPVGEELSRAQSVLVQQASMEDN